MMIKKIQNNRGFVILYAVTLSAILLAIALGVADVALKEVKFGTNARDTNNAFFAADTGIESVLFNDKNPLTYPEVPNAIQSYGPFVVSGLGSDGASCAIITIQKDNQTNPAITVTTIISKGYNIGDVSCSSSNPDRIEREIKVSY